MSAGPEAEMPRRRITLSQVFFFVSKFAEVKEVEIDWATIIDDVIEPPKLESNCQKLEISFSNIDANAILKLIKTLHIPPKNLFLNANQIRGSIKDIEDSGLFPEEQIWTLDSHKDYSEKENNSL